MARRMELHNRVINPAAGPKADDFLSLAAMVDVAMATGYWVLSKRLDDRRTRWLHGYRGVLGFAYLTLVAP
jgi:hypothetical protein